MDLKLKDPEFWYTLHGNVPGMLDWDMGNELFLPCTSDQYPLTEQNLVKYKLRVMEPPKVTQGKKTNIDNDGPDSEPNLWMWVNPSVVCSVGSQEVPKPNKEKDLTRIPSSTRPLPKKSNCLETIVIQSLPSCSSEQFPQQQNFTSPSNWKFTEKETEEQDNEYSVTLPPTKKGKGLQIQKLRQDNGQEQKLWPRPPLNYSHLISLALRNSPPCGLNVQQIYSFTQEHFPFFWTAPQGWKNTVRHNLCFLGSFEKSPISLEDETNTKPRPRLWRLTEEGHRRFQEETRALASARRESIQQSMSQPDVMTSLFDL